MTTQTATIDVMTNHGRTFYHTLHYSYCPLFKFDLDKMVSWITGKLPSLLYRSDAVLFLKFPDGEEMNIQIINNKKPQIAWISD